MIIKCSWSTRIQSKGRISSFKHILTSKFMLDVMGNGLFGTTLNKDNKFLKSLNLKYEG